MPKQRMYAIGDIHGRLDLLSNLLNKLRDQEKLNLVKDKLIFLGDFIDRGPQSYEVIVKLQELKNRYHKNVVILQGNHEDLMIKAYTHGEKWLWKINGGVKTIKSFHRNNANPWNSIKWLSSLPFKYETSKFFFSHAPVPKNEYRRKENQGKPLTKRELTWTYFGGDTAECMEAPSNKIGVCGHIHSAYASMYEPRIYNHYIYVDTGCGCVSTAPLTAVEVYSRYVIQSDVL